MSSTQLTLRHEPRGLWVTSLCASSQPKVAHFEVAVGVEKEVGRLEVAVDDCGSVRGSGMRKSVSTYSRQNEAP
jgi:hypothetical protein